MLQSSQIKPNFPDGLICKRWGYLLHNLLNNQRTVTKTPWFCILDRLAPLGGFNTLADSADNLFWFLGSLTNPVIQTQTCPGFTSENLLKNMFFKFYTFRAGVSFSACLEVVL